MIMPQNSFERRFFSSTADSSYALIWPQFHSRLEFSTIKKLGREISLDTKVSIGDER